MYLPACRRRIGGTPERTLQWQVLVMIPVTVALLAIVACTAVGRVEGPPVPRVRADSLRRADFRRERLAAYRDSFEVVTRDPGSDRDRLVGWRRASMAAHPGGFLYGEEEGTEAGKTKALDVVLDSALEVRAARSAGRFFGKTEASNIAYENGRARGAAEARLPPEVPVGGGERLRVPVDTILPAGAFDALALLGLVPLLDWQPEAAYLLPVFDAAESSITYQVLRIGAPEWIDVPAGRYHVYPAELTTTGRPVRLWVTTAVPHRIVRIDVEADRTRMMLAASSPPLFQPAEKGR